MAYRYSLKDKYIKKDKWVKEVKKSFNPEILSTLIKNRLENPWLHGPTVTAYHNEQATDIINLFFEEDEECRDKLIPAIGLLIFKANKKEKVDIPLSVMKQVFYLVYYNRITECYKLLYEWVFENMEAIKTKDSFYRATFHMALQALDMIQPVDPVLKSLWHHLWSGNDQYWWWISIKGLAFQNANLAVKELDKAIARKVEYLDSTLLSMWRNTASRYPMSRELAKGLNENTGWAGQALNSLWKKLSDDERDELMVRMKRLNDLIDGKLIVPNA